MTPNDAGAIVKFILATWPSQRMRMTADDLAAFTRSYRAGLDDLDEAQTRAAIIRLAKTSEWIPTIAAIRRAVGVVAVGRQKSPMEAWEEVHRMQQKHGSHQTPGEDFVFSDPLTARVVSAIGWLEICRSSTPDHIRARFLDAYEEISKAERETMAASAGANRNPLLEHREDRKIAARRNDVEQIGGLVKSLLPAAVDEINDEPCIHESTPECPERCRCECARCFARICELARKIGGGK